MIEHYLIGEPKDVVVLLHDSVSSCAAWQSFPQKIHEQTGRGVFYYSRYNHGKSSKSTEPFSYDGEVETLRSLLEENAITNPTIFAHSDGAAISINYASKYDVKKLVLTAPFIKYEESVAEYFRVMKTKLEEGSCPSWREFHDDVDHMFNQVYTRATGDEYKQFDLTEVARNIKCPVEVVRKQNDPISSDFQLKLISESIPHAVITLIPGTNHSVHKNNPYLLISKL